MDLILGIIAAITYVLVISYVIIFHFKNKEK